MTSVASCVILDLSIKGDIEMNNQTWCYTILATQYDENGFIPSRVDLGVKGHSPMTGPTGTEPWYWGKTLEEAEATCAHANMKMNLSQDRVFEIECSTL